MPHRVGRACLTNGFANLGRCAIETTEKHSREQDNRAGKGERPHVKFPGFGELGAWAQITCSPKGGESTISILQTSCVVFCRI